MKREVFKTIFGVLLVVGIFLLLSTLLTSSSPRANADSVVPATCSIYADRTGQNIAITGDGACAGLSFNFDVSEVSGEGRVGGESVQIPSTQVTIKPDPLPPITLPPRTIEVPGPVRTILPEPRTVTLPPVVETQRVEVPGPTQTVTRAPAPEPAPAETVTVTPRPQPRPTATVTETTPPQPTETETIVLETRQPATEDATIEPEDGVVVIPDITLSPTEVVGLGTITILLLILLILLGMWAGYYMGYKDSDKAEAKFYRALLGK